MTKHTKLRKLNQTPQGESWTALTKRLMESHAWRCMTLADRLVLDRLMLEHMYHAGKCNGALKCTYNDFEKHGVRRASIRESINRLCALGLIKRTRVGRRGYGDAKGEAAEYELTFYRTRTENNNIVPPSHDWMRFENMEAAQKAAGKRTKTHFPQLRKRTIPSDKTLLGPQGKMGTQTLLDPSDASATPFYICGYPGESEPWSERELAHIQKLRTEYLSWPLPDLETAIAGAEAEIANPTVYKHKLRAVLRYLEAFRSAAHQVRNRQITPEANHGSDNPRVPDAVA